MSNLNSRQPLPRQIVRCDHCGADSGRPVTGLLNDAEGQDPLPPTFRDERFQFRQCDQCNLVYLPERPSRDDLDVYYSAAYKCFQSYSDRGWLLSRLAAALARRKLHQIQALMPATSNTLLDFGCGTGTWLQMLQRLQAPFRMIGTDVVEHAVESVRALGLEAHCCDDSTLLDHVAEASVGVVHNFHVIEHVPSPQAMLTAIYKVLVPGGILLGQTPNVASWGRRFWKDHWNQWHMPRHFVLFDHQTLRREALRAGFEVVSISNSLSGATQWAQSALSWWAAKRGRHFQGVHEKAYGALIIASLPVAFIEGIVSHNCHMDFALRRPA